MFDVYCSLLSVIVDLTQLNVLKGEFKDTKIYLIIKNNLCNNRNMYKTNVNIIVV